MATSIEPRIMDLLMELQQAADAPLERGCSSGDDQTVVDVDPLLEAELVRIADTGIANLPWELLRVLLSVRLEQAVRYLRRREGVLSTDQAVQLGENSPVSGPAVERVQLSEESFGFIRGEAAFLERIFEMRRDLNSFPVVPWTLQRMCELLVKPHPYRSVDKYCQAFSKLVSGIRAEEQRVRLPADFQEEIVLPSFMHVDLDANPASIPSIVETGVSPEDRPANGKKCQISESMDTGE